jgi:hypothetical protein
LCCCFVLKETIIPFSSWEEEFGKKEEKESLKARKATYDYVTKPHPKKSDQNTSHDKIEDKFINSVISIRLLGIKEQSIEKYLKTWIYKKCIFHIFRLSRLERYKLMR